MQTDHRRTQQGGSIEQKILTITENTMKTSYGLEFNTVTEIDPEWSDYDKKVAECHLANAGVVIVDAEYGQPVDLSLIHI